MEILFTPGSYYSVHDDLIFTVRDNIKANDPVTYPDYRYIADVYNGAELVARLKAYPQPDSKIGEFNISNILRNYITPVLNPNLVSFDAQDMDLGDFNVSGTVIFGEEYGFTQYLNVSGDTGRRYFGHYNGRKLGVQTNLSSLVNKFATIRPIITTVYRNSKNVFLPFFMNADDPTVDIRLYNYDGSPGYSVTTSQIANDFHLSILNISPAAIDAMVFPIFTEQTEYYTVEVGASGIYRFNLVCEPKYDVHILHFLNRFGGWETKEFTKLSRKNINIEKSEFGKRPHTLSDAGVPQYYSSSNVYNETRSVFASQYKERMTLNSDHLTDGDYIWLSDLVLSPIVYMEMTNDDDDIFFIPIVITETDYEIKKGVNDKSKNLTINIEFGERFNAQYR